jgi:hypothetical protein
VDPTERNAALLEEQRLWVFEDRALGIFQPQKENAVERWEDFHLFGLLDL